MLFYYAPSIKEQEHVLDWLWVRTDMSSHGLFFQWSSTSSACWSNSRQTLPLSHQKITCPCDDISEKMSYFVLNTIIHSLTLLNVFILSTLTNIQFYGILILRHLVSQYTLWFKAILHLTLDFLLYCFILYSLYTIFVVLCRSNRLILHRLLFEFEKCFST